MTPKPKFWHGTPPTVCDLTGKPITDEFVDGKTAQGPWGILHPIAHKQFGCGVGTGLGQRYRRQPDGRWLKVEG